MMLTRPRERRVFGASGPRLLAAAIARSLAAGALATRRDASALVAAPLLLAPLLRARRERLVLADGHLRLLRGHRAVEQWPLALVLVEPEGRGIRIRGAGRPVLLRLAHWSPGERDALLAAVQQR